MEKKKENTRLDVKSMISDFTNLQQAKKNASLSMILICVICTTIVLGAFMFTSITIRNVTDKILVVNTGGEFLKVQSTEQDKLYETLLIAHCSSVAYYVNSFDRNSITTNQAKAVFLVEKNDLNSIFDKYLKDRAYLDAQNRGIVYKCAFEKLQSVSIRGDSYNVVFSSILTIYDGKNKTKIRIFSKGDAIRTTPTYPENVSGFFFKNYIQEYELINS